MRAARILLAPYLIALLLITWLPGNDASKVTGIVATAAWWLDGAGLPFAIAYPVLEFVVNIALFVPFGLLVALAWPPVPNRWIVFAGFATSGVIELVQLALPTRYPALSDVIANTLGALAGCGIAVLVHGFRRRVRSSLGR